MRQPQERISDILGAIDDIESYRKLYEPGPGASTDEQVVLDAILYRLLVIGEAVGDLPDEVRGLGPSIPWEQIKGLRDVLAHRYFSIKMEVIDEVLVNRIPELKQVAKKIAAELPGGSLYNTGNPEGEAEDL